MITTMKSIFHSDPLYSRHFKLNMKNASILQLSSLDTEKFVLAEII